MSTLEWVGIGAVVEHVVLASVLFTLPWWGRALVARLISGQRILPWGKR